jgi:hypothetical protein
MSLSKQVRTIYTSYAIDALDSQSRDALKYYSKLAGADSFLFDKRLNGMGQWVKDYFASGSSEENKKVVANAMREMNSAVRNYIMTQDAANAKYLPAIRELEEKIRSYKPQPAEQPVAVANDSFFSALGRKVRHIAAGSLLALAACAGLSPAEYASQAKGSYDSYLQLSEKSMKDRYSIPALDAIIDAHRLYRLAEDADTSSEQYKIQLRNSDLMGKATAAKALSLIEDKETFDAYEQRAREEGFLDGMTPEDAQRYNRAKAKFSAPAPEPQPEAKPDPFTQQPKPAEQPAPAAPAPTPAPAAQPAAPAVQPGQQPAQPPAPVTSAPEVYRVTTDTLVASNQSTQKREEYLTLQTPYLDGLFQWHANKVRVPEIDGHDKLSESGFGGNLTGKIFFVEAGVTYSKSTAKRDHPTDSAVTTTLPFIITTSTDVDEKNEKTYTAFNAKAKLGRFAPKLTLYQSLDDLAVDVNTDVNVDNTADPAGDHAYVISDTITSETKRKGLLAGLDYKEGNVTGGVVGGVERTEVSMDDKDPRKWDVYTGLVYAGLKGEKDDYAVSAGIGKRLTDDSEKHCRFDPLHWYANGAVDLGAVEDQNVTAFGSLWRLTDPAGGLGLVIGKGPAVTQVMDYYNSRAWEQLDYLKHLGPDERKVYLTQLMNDLRRGLCADNNLRLMLFGGARRNESYAPEDLGKDRKQMDWIADVVLSIPVWQDEKNKDNYFILAPYFHRDANGQESYIGGGLEAVLPGGKRVRVGGGQLEVEGAKHGKAPAVTFGLEWPF